MKFVLRSELLVDNVPPTICFTDPACKSTQGLNWVILGYRLNGYLVELRWERVRFGAVDEERIFRLSGNGNPAESKPQGLSDRLPYHVQLRCVMHIFTGDHILTETMRLHLSFRDR